MRVAPPTDHPDTADRAAGRVRHAAFTPDHTAIRHALARHAPPHVQITDT